MAHELAMKVTGQAAMAYMGDTPWHGLGTKMSTGMTVAQWRAESGLDFVVHKSPVGFAVDDRSFSYPERLVLYRGDTNAPLSVVSRRYEVVQPAQVMDFFEEICEAGGFTLETAGVLQGGKKVWALARVNQGANVLGQDKIRPFVLLVTSYDGSSPTIGKFIAERVVCANTLAIALGELAGSTKAGVSSIVSVSHRSEFKADDMRQKLGIAINGFDEFVIKARMLANRELGIDAADKQTIALLHPAAVNESGALDVLVAKEVREAKGYKRIMALFDGEAKGADMAGYSAWGWLNAVTQWTDWERGRSADSRVDSMFFGDSARLKGRALNAALALVS